MSTTDANPGRYLASSAMINWHDTAIRELAGNISRGCDSQTGIAQRCFEWVRDNIRHSYDYQLGPVTCKASDVLHHKTGYCFAKSHLLAALLRANNIPAGLCYQRLRVEPGKERYCLHGLNAVYLREWGWYRIDARGNKFGVDAQFCPPVEKLAFVLQDEGEYNIPDIYCEPLHVVVETLTKYKTTIEVYHNLPDVNE
jgi:transglutaminase-like putative cysteine protease